MGGKPDGSAETTRGHFSLLFLPCPPLSLSTCWLMEGGGMSFICRIRPWEKGTVPILAHPCSGTYFTQLLLLALQMRAMACSTLCGDMRPVSSGVRVSICQGQ